jgi:hypothetical protein
MHHIITCLANTSCSGGSGACVLSQQTHDSMYVHIHAACMNACKYLCMYASTYVCMHQVITSLVTRPAVAAQVHACTLARLTTDIRRYVYVCIYVCMHLCTHHVTTWRQYVCTYTCSLHACMRACMHHTITCLARASSSGGPGACVHLSASHNRHTTVCIRMYVCVYESMYAPRNHLFGKGVLQRRLRCMRAPKRVVH